MAESQPTIGYFSLLRDNKNFRFLWLGEVVSLFGDWFNLIASAALVSLLTKSGLAVGGLFIARMLAPFLISPFAGVAADRYNRKWLLVLTDITRAIVVLGFLFVRNPTQIWLLYGLTVIQLAISGIFFPTRNAILPDLVSQRGLGAANALSSATWSVMLAVGAALGGIVAGQWGIYTAFIIDSLTFVLSALFIVRIKYKFKSELSDIRFDLGSVIQEYLDGLRYLKRHKDVFVIAIQKGAVALIVSGAFQIIQVLLAERHYVIGEGGETGLGIMYAVAGIGTGIGPIAARIFTGDREWPLRISIGFSYGLCIIGLLMVAPLKNFETVLLGNFVRTLGTGINWVFSTQLLFRMVSEDTRGRVFSTDFAFFTLAHATSTAIGGWLLDNTSLGINGLLWLMAFLTFIPGFFWLFWIGRLKKSVLFQS